MEPYLGEIRMFAFGQAPEGWLPCEGQILLVFQHSALYSLIRNTYGGRERETFALPDLRGRVPVGMVSAPKHDSDYELGRKGGAGLVALGLEEMPPHSHDLNVALEASQTTVRNTIYAPTPGHPLYAAFHDKVVFPIDSGMIGETGKGEGHYNWQPSLAVCYCIAVRGIYPPHA